MAKFYTLVLTESQRLLIKTAAIAAKKKEQDFCRDAVMDAAEKALEGVSDKYLTLFANLVPEGKE